MTDPVPRETPPTPDAARRIFGVEVSVAQRYAALLAGPARDRGLMGPRELPRLWERHILNCAVLTDLVPLEAAVCDVGSGAGLPGLVMAIRRPDLRLTLLEPLLRRTLFLEEAVEALGLRNVEVVRGRAETLRGVRTFDVVTSRAVAGMGVLMEWSLPLAEVGGFVLAMKGQSAERELAEAAGTITRLGGREPEVRVIEEFGLLSPTTVVRVEAGGIVPLPWAAAAPTATSSSSRRAKRRR